MNIWRDLMNFHHGVHEALDTLKCEDLDGSAVRSPDALCHTWLRLVRREEGAPALAAHADGPREVIGCDPWHHVIGRLRHPANLPM